MPRLNIEQGSQKWHDYRACHIMATSASVIMGSNEYKNELQLWNEMQGITLPKKPTKKMLEGVRLEPIARLIANELIGIDFEPCVYESDKYPWMAASLDGLSPCGKYILEIKCGERAHLNAINKIITLGYQDQLTHQLNCVETAIKTFYFTYWPDFEIKNTICEFLLEAKRSQEMIVLEEIFWGKYCMLEIPVWELKNNKRNIL